MNQSPVPPVRSAHASFYPTLDTTHASSANPFGDDDEKDDDDDDDRDDLKEKSTTNR